MAQPIGLTPKQTSIKKIETYMKSYENFFQEILNSVNKFNIDYQINYNPNSNNYYSLPNDKIAHYSNHFTSNNFKLITHNDIHGVYIDLKKYKCAADITINIHNLFNILTGNNDNKEWDDHFYIFNVNKKTQMTYKEATQIIPDNYDAFNELRFELDDVHKIKVCKFQTDEYFIFIIFNDNSLNNNGNFIFKDHSKVEEIKKDDFNYNNVISHNLNTATNFFNNALQYQVYNNIRANKTVLSSYTNDEELYNMCATFMQELSKIIENNEDYCKKIDNIDNNIKEIKANKKNNNILSCIKFF